MSTFAVQLYTHKLMMLVLACTCKQKSQHTQNVPCISSLGLGPNPLDQNAHFPGYEPFDVPPPLPFMSAH